MKKLVTLLRFSLLVVPVVFILLGIKFGDFFYFILALVSLVFWVFVLLPKLFSERQFALPKIKLNFFKFKTPKITEPEIISNLEKKTFGRKFLKKRHFPLFLILVLSQLFFVYLAVFKLPIISDKNLLLGFYLSQLSLLRNYWGYLIPGFVLAVFFFIFVDKKSQVEVSHPKKFLNTVSKSVATVLLIAVFSLGVSFFTTYAFAIIHSNVSATGKIIAGEKDVLDKLKNSDKAPKIVGIEKGLKRTLISTNLDKNNSYGKYYTQKIIPSIPDKFLFVNVPKEALVMSGNSIFISEIKKNEIESVSPTIGKLLVKQQLEPRYIKDEPEVKVLSRQEYLKFRDDQINKQLAKVDELLAELNKSINIIYSNIQIDKNNMAAADALIQNSISKRDSDYSYCKTAGYTSFYFGTFYRTYSDSECDAKRQEWDNYIAGLQTNIQQNQSNLSYQQSQLGQYQEYKKIFVDYRPYIEAQKESAPQELGLFEPDKSVKIVLETTSNKAIADYFETLVHEYLHYTSYVSEERQLPLFFEEGLTEYFSRKIVKDQIGTNTNLGYPVIVKIIEEIAKKIPEDDLKNIYFTKDEKALIGLLNDKYGSKFYDESKFYFEAISYVSSKDALKFANNIMFKIGGRELKEEDLISTYSELK